MNLKLWQQTRSRLRALFQKERLDREMDEELRFHIEMQMKDNLEEGMASEQARQAAWQSFGGVEQVKEVCRDGRGIAWFETFWQDAKWGTRLFLKESGLTVAVTTILALGIGTNTVVFTWIRATLVDAIPGVTDPHRLLVVLPRQGTSGLGENMSIPDIESVAADRGTFAGITGSQMGAVPVRLGTTTEWLWGQTTLANFFDVLAVPPILGRGFASGEDRPGAPGVAVISHSLWQKRFNASPDVLGKIIQINQRPITIVGVAPETFRGTVGGLAFDLWVPLATESGLSDLTSVYQARGKRWLQTIARLSNGKTRSQARAALDAVGQRLAGEFPETNKETNFTVVPVWESPWGGQALFLPVLRVLAIVSVMLLVLTMANTSNLLLARGLSRQREMALRLAVGCSAGRLARLVLTECLLLACLGGIGGLLFAHWGRNVLLWLMPPSYLPIQYELPLSGGIFAATATLTLLAGLVVGLVPAWRALPASVNDCLRSSGSTFTISKSHARFRHALAAAQVAIAFVLLVGMGLCSRSYSVARRMNLGFDPSGVWLAGFRLNSHSENQQTTSRFYRRLQTEASRLPGVEAVAVSSYVPLGIEGIDRTSVSVPGYQARTGETADAGIEVVSPGYFKTLRIPLAVGREFTDADDERVPSVAIVNEAFAERYFGGAEAVGRKFDTGNSEVQIIGIARNAKYGSLAEAPLPYVYVCAWQRKVLNMTLALRTKVDPAQLNLPVTRLARSLNPEAPPHASMSCDDYVRAAFIVPRVGVAMLSFLSMVALLLAVMGIYAVVSHQVNQRIREIAVRIALGAQVGKIIWLVGRQGLNLLLLGLSIGIPAAFALGLLISSLLVGVSATDLPTWLLTPTVLVTAVLAACWIPARRAVRFAPVAALRVE
jgi:predicted permease